MSEYKKTYGKALSDLNAKYVDDHLAFIPKHLVGVQHAILFLSGSFAR